jgi:hypothetical protein
VRLVVELNGDGDEVALGDLVELAEEVVEHDLIFAGRLLGPVPHVGTTPA